MAARYTCVGPDLWFWKPFIACSLEAQRFWLALYTCPESKNLIVGMNLGGMAGIAEQARMPYGDAANALDELIDRKMMEHDQHYRLVRMTMLPDRGERPANGSALLRMWRGFQTLPQCAVRDRHVGLLKWLIGTFTGDHRRVWDDTFATLETESGTYDTVSDTVSASRQSELFNSANIRHRVEHRVEHPRERERVREMDLDLGSGEGESEREARFAVGTGVGEPPARLGPLPSPPKPAFGATAMLEAIAAAAGPRWHGTLVDDRLNPALAAVAHQCAAKGVTLADLDLAGRYLREGGLAYRNDLGASWAAKPGSVLDLVAAARDWERGDVVLDDSGPAKIYPASAFVGGRREL